MATPEYSATIDPRQFRRALGNFATGVTVVTTCDSAGGAVGVTASSFNSVSLTPPLILWSLDKSALSCSAFETSEHFIVNVLASDQLAVSERFARRGSEKFQGLEFSQGVGGAPLLAGCAASFQCRRTFIYEGGDHLILVGEVVSFAESGQAALLFYRGQYSVSEPHPQLRRVQGAHTPGGFVADYLDYLLSQAAATLQRGFSAVLSGAGLDPFEWRVLVTLGDHDQGLGAGELSIIVLIPSSALDEILARLCGRDWIYVTRAPDGTHRYHLSAAGHATLVPMQAAATALEADALGCLEHDEARQLKEMLKRLVASAGPSTR